jgi:hypothetical protein
LETTYEILGKRTSFNSTNDRTLVVVASTGFFEGQIGYAIVHTISQTLFGTNGAQINTQKWTLVVGKQSTKFSILLLLIVKGKKYYNHV